MPTSATRINGKKLVHGGNDSMPQSPSPLHWYSSLTIRERRFVDAYVNPTNIALTTIDTARLD
jgi:hypothetical protein